MTLTSGHESSHSPASNRQPGLDWLRVVGVWLLVPFHVAVIFSPGLWYIKHPESSRVLTYGIAGMLDPWHMPLLFLLAGFASWYSLQRHTPNTFLVERVKRLLVPFVFGILLVIPIEQYFAALHHQTHTGTFLTFWTGYFATIPTKPVFERRPTR